MQSANDITMREGKVTLLCKVDINPAITSSEDCVEASSIPPSHSRIHEPSPCSAFSLYSTHSTPEDGERQGPPLDRVCSFDEHDRRNMHPGRKMHQHCGQQQQLPNKLLQHQPEVFHFLEWMEDSSIDDSVSDNFQPHRFLPVKEGLEASDDAVVGPRQRLQEVVVLQGETDGGDEDQTPKLHPPDTTRSTCRSSEVGPCGGENRFRQVPSYICDGIPRNESSGGRNQRSAIQMVRINSRDGVNVILPQQTCERIDHSIQMSLSYYNQTTNRILGADAEAPIPRVIYIRRRESRWRRQLGRSWSRLLSRKPCRGSGMAEF